MDFSKQEPLSPEDLEVLDQYLHGDAPDTVPGPSHTIRPMTEEDWDKFQLQALIEGAENDEAVRQSYDRALMRTELSDYDLAHMQEIIKDGLGNWYKARLLRFLHEVLSQADGNNLRRLRTAYPGTCAAYMAWYNGRIPAA